VFYSKKRVADIKNISGEINICLLPGVEWPLWPGCNTGQNCYKQDDFKRHLD